nr:methylase [Treponemataceae bacterium]
MTQIEQQKAAKDFADFWKDKGDEKQESQRFWIQLLQNVLGVSDPASYIEFEKRVQLAHTSYIDAYIAGTKVLIEQKGLKIDIHKAYEQSDGAILSPFEQAKRYADELPNSIRPRWIVVCNFAEFLVYDLENPHGEPEQIFLKDLPKEFYRLQFLVDQKNENIRREEELSLKAGELVGNLYDAMYNEFIPPVNAVPTDGNKRGLSAFQLRSLNILCVRIVFCLYAEDAGLFDTKTSFEDYIKSFYRANLRKGIIELFKALDTKNEERDQYDDSLKPFPYVNGGLFRDAKIEIPNFTDEIVDVIVNHCAPFNWSDISPTIFGAVFESTLNPETRRKGGMHYTSIQNIHKVIDPLFMDDLTAEFESICAIKASKQKAEKLLVFQNKLGTLKFLDPACGSGNFLTETYLCIRRLENRIISILNKGERVFGFDEFIKVHINQFYGIEINDFAVTVAKTAMWIAESQMVAETEAIISQTISFLPLKTGANIIEGNALRIDWGTLAEEEQTGFLFTDKLNVYKIDSDLGYLEMHEPDVEYGKHYKELNVVTKEVEEKELPKTKKEAVVYDYIIGNPPFIGYSLQSVRQKEDTLLTYVDINGKPYKTAGKIDYVANWYFKAAKLILNTKTRCAFVSTNSICQGEQVASVWKPIFERFKIHIDFAYKTFKWENETSDKKNMAAVHCVIIGFSNAENKKPKKLFLNETQSEIVPNINAYLISGTDVFVESRPIPLCDVPQMSSGGKPVEGGHLIFTDEEKTEFLKKEPSAEKYFRPFMGSDDFINGHGRWCLWLLGVSPKELLSMPLVMKHVEAVREFRLASVKAATREYANYPSQFMEIKQPESDYLMIPATSSENREYVPIGYLDKNVVASNAASFVPNATLYHFGVLTSNVHNTWMRVVCGRLEMRYRYSVNIVYNNFPWCTPTEEQKTKIE